MTTKPFLSVPFRGSDLPQWYTLSEGYFYTDTPWRYWRTNFIHAGIDYDVPYGTAIYSPIDGYACASYNIQWARDESDNIYTYQDKQITYSLGYCIQLYHPESNLFLLYWHLSYIAEEITFVPPFTTEIGEQFAKWFNLTSDHIENIDECSWLVKVSRGQYLGDVGASGIYFTDKLIPWNSKPLMRIPESRYHYYSKPHLHWNTYDRTPDGTKQKPLDPYDIYDYADKYPDPQRWKKELWKDHLMLLWDDWFPRFIN